MLIAEEMSNRCYINVRESPRGNQEWTIQGHCPQHWVHKTHDVDKQNIRHNTEN